MSEATGSRLDDVIARVLDECGYRTSPYFAALREKRFAKEDFVESQIQFYFAVVFFSRPMATLAAKIPTPELRMEVLRNVWEEHGEGDCSRVHRQTFLAFLERLAGVMPADVERRALWPEVRAFNTALAGACVLDEYLVGVGVLGMIERMFCEISAWIGREVVANGWLPSDRMIHYSLHEQIDVKHSQDFFDILGKRWARSAEDRYAVEQGLWLGATLFAGLYDGLYRNRTRRWGRETTGPHSRADGAA